MMLVHLAAAAVIGLAGGAVQERLREVSPGKLSTCVQRLEGFGTRHTLSDTTSETRGIGAARRWIKSQMESFNPPGGGLVVEFEEFDVPRSVRVPEGARVVNVVGVLPGTMPEASSRAYYVVGHYDSRNGDALDAAGDAPGANDDASGTAVVIEIARVLAAHPLESTVVFLCTAGEEQGLLGAKGHAEKKAAAKGLRVCGVLNNDIVGDPLGRLYPPGNGGSRGLGLSGFDKDSPERRAAGTVRVFSEGIPRTTSPEVLARIRSLAGESDSSSRQLARFVASVAEAEGTDVRPTVIFRPDRFLRGGDHSAFNEAGFAAVRFTVPNEDFTRQHANVEVRDGQPYGDVARFVDSEYLAGVTRLNLATLMHMANAPSVPGNVRVMTAKLDNDTTLRWEKSPEPDTAGYEVVWRDTTSWTWDHVKDVGNVTEMTLPISKDNVFFGVRAYDTGGLRSPTAFAGDAKE